MQKLLNRRNHAYTTKHKKSRDTNNNGNKVVREMNRKENNQGKKLLLFIKLYHLN